MSTKPNKTQLTTNSVESFLSGVSPDTRRDDSAVICEMMERLSGEQPKMWGPGIVGFGVRHYRYESGRQGDILRIGFSPRKESLVLYGFGNARADEIAELGKLTTGKGCIYIKRLADIKLPLLEAMIFRAWLSSKSH